MDLHSVRGVWGVQGLIFNHRRFCFQNAWGLVGLNRMSHWIIQKPLKTIGGHKKLHCSTNFWKQKNIWVFLNGCFTWGWNGERFFSWMIALSLTDAWRACQRFERPGSMSTSWMSAAASCTVGQECARGTVGYSWYLERLDLIAKLIVVTWHLPMGLGLELRLLLKKCTPSRGWFNPIFPDFVRSTAVDT